MKENTERMSVRESHSIKEVMNNIGLNGLGIAFIIDDEDKLVGTVTDGDIRRAILRGVSIDTQISKIMITEPTYIKQGWSKEKITEMVRTGNAWLKIAPHGVIKIPVIDHKGKIIDFVFALKREYGDGETPIINRADKPEEAKTVSKVLVIGGAGYFGSILCRKLLENGYQVRVLDNLIYGDIGVRDLYNHSNFDFVKGDIRNLQVVAECLKGMDAVIHLAAIVGDPASALNPQETIEINYLSTKMIAEACKYYQINRFIFASTCSVYGVSPTPDARINEGSSLNPVSLYATMKLKSEKGILELVDENFSPTILRMATLYGLSPRMRFDLVVNLLTAKAAIDKKITLFGGEQWRPNLHVRDAAEAYIKCLEAPISKIGGVIFNLGSNDLNHQIKELGEIIHSMVPDSEIITDEENVDLRDYNVAFDKINKILNYKTTHTIEDGVVEIRDAIEKGIIKDYNNDKYSNYKFLLMENSYLDEKNI